jgi:hypothetical protein
MATSYSLIFLGSAQAQSITIGQTTVLSIPDGGNANLLIAQSAKLAQAATIESMSFYVTAAGGNLILGIYGGTGPGGGPGMLKASTVSFTPKTGWNTASVATPVSLAAGTYWLAYMPSSNNLGFVRTSVASGNCDYYAYNFGSLPIEFSTSPVSCGGAWSLYATFTVSPSGPTPTGGAVNGACGSSNAADLTSKPTTNLCSAGTASNVSGSGPWSWTCAGSGRGATVSCTALLETNGACGSANGSTVSTAPTTNLCTAGTASNVSGNGPWSWTCAGGNGGSTASCTDKLASTGTTGTSSSDPTTGLLPSDRDASANWKMAGLQSVGGIPNRTTICATLSPSGRDDTANIQAAINNCTAATPGSPSSGGVVMLSAGTFTIGEGNFVKINKSITVRGSGPCAGTGIGTAPYPSSAQSHCTLIQRTNGASLTTNSGGTNPTPHFVMGVPDQYGNLSLGTATNLAVNGAAGGTTIQVASTSGFSAEQIVLIDEASNLGWRPSWTYSGEEQWSPPDYRIAWPAQNPTCQSGSQGCNGGSTPPTVPCYFNFSGADCDHYTNEIKRVASIGAGPCPGTNCTITFDSPLTISYRVANAAHVAPFYGSTPAYATAPVYYVGLENMTLQNADGSSIVMDACAYCWVKNEEDTIMYGYFSSGSISIQGGFRDQLEGVYTHKGVYPVYGGAGYNWSIDRGSSEILIENSVSMQNDKVMVMREGGAGSVVAYNYFDESILGTGSGETEVGMNASHWMGSHHVLFEGNWSYNFGNDGTWGSQNYITLLRNDLTGFRTPFYDYYDKINIDDATDTPGIVPWNGIYVSAFVYNDYWYSMVGNVMGTPGQMSGWSYKTNTNNARGIWNIGISDGSGVDNEVWSQQATASACVSSTGDQCPLTRLSNYDYVTNSLADSSNPTIPNSFYLSSAPAFFSSGSGYTWPWVNSQGSTKVQSGPTTSACTTNIGGPCSGLPAKARIDNGTPFTQP